MAGTLVKICGVTTPTALEACIAARADYVGFNFCAVSPRFLAPGSVRTLADQAAGRIARVGVFLDADDDLIADYLRAGGLEAIQLHGEETPERTAQLKARYGLPVWKVISVATRDDIAKSKAYEGAADLILFDAKTPKGSMPGGMGLAFDWTLLSGYLGALPWGLAGGLRPNNVAEAVRISGAPLVDTSSGVESSVGIKDVDLIKAFCQAARSTP